MMNSLLKAHKTPYAQMVTPTQLKRQEGGVIKGSVVQQKTKDGLTEVRDIFSRVEHAFKKRKDETKVLEIEVGELERNLDYLENQTQDQIKETAALNLAYVHTTAAISSLDENIGAVNGGDLATCKELAENLNLSVESALKVNEDAHRDLSLVNAALDAIIEEASILLRDMEKDLKEAALRETGIQEMRMGMEEVKKQISEDEVFLKEERITIAQLDSAIGDGNKNLEATEQHCILLQTEIADQETRKQNLLTEKTALAAAHQAALESEAVWRRRHEQECHQKDDEVEALRKEFQKLQAARLSAAERLDVQQKHNTEKEASNAEMRRVLRQKATDLAGHQASLAGIETEIAQLQQSVDQVRTDLAESRQNVVHATKSNEEQYELACCRMAQLRVVHQEDAAVTYALNAAKEALNSRVRELDATIASKQLAVTQQQQAVEQQRHELTGAEQTLQDLREQARVQKEANEAARLAQQVQQEEMARLEHFAVELQWEVEERARQATLLLEEKTLYAAQEQQNASLREAARVEEEEIAALNQAIAEAKAALKKKHAAVALTPEQDAQLNEEVEREVQEHCREKDEQQAVEVAEMESCRLQLERKLPEIEAQNAKKLNDKKAEITQALAELAAAEAAQVAREEARMEAEALAQAQAREEAQAQALAQAQAAAEEEARLLAIQEQQGLDREAEQEQAALQAKKEARERALEQKQKKATAAHAKKQAAAAEAHARVLAARAEAEALAQAAAQVEEEAKEAQAKSTAAAAETRKVQLQQEKQNEKKSAKAKKKATTQDAAASHVQPLPAEQSEIIPVADAVDSTVYTGDWDDHDDFLIAGSDSFFTERSDAHHEVRASSKRATQFGLSSGSSISSNLLFEEHTTAATTHAAVSVKRKHTSPEHTFSVPYGSKTFKAPNTPQEYQSLWEQSQPATKLPSLPPHPAKELAPSPAALQARESTSTAVATTARIRNGIASQRTAEDVAEEKVAEEEDYEDGDGTGEQGDRGEAEQEDEVSASTTASSADRRKAKQKRHKENQKLRKKLLQVSSSERSGASDASLNFLQPYQPVQTTAPAIAGGKMKVKVNPITKASATAPPRAATTMHATPPLTVSAPFATAGRTAAVKPPVPRFDGYRQNAAPAASVPTAAPASKNLAAATKSTFKRSQQHTQHTQPSCVQAPTKQVSVLHRSASVNSRQPVKTLKPPSKTSTAASSSNDWYSEDAPF